MNKNYVGIKVEPYTSGTHPGIVVGTTISCDAASYTFSGTSSFATIGSSSVQLKVPYSSVRSLVGMEISGVSNIAVGNAAGNVNTFQDMDCGISSRKSNVTVNNDDFDNFTFNSYSNTSPRALFSGIYAVGGTSTYTLTIGGSSPYCTFSNCDTGINAYYNVEANIQHNTIGGDNTKLSVGVNLQYDDNITSNLIVSTNGISACQKGINCLDNVGSTVTIGNNTITGISTLKTCYGIDVNEYSHGPSTSYIIGDNYPITNVTMGIYSNLLQSGHVFYNNITLDGASTTSEGIYMIHPYLCTVTHNTVSGPTTPPNKQDGIRFNMGTPSNTVTCNTTNTTYNGLLFYGSQSPMKVDQNRINTYTNAGLYLMTGGTIGAQTSAAITTYNYWAPCFGTTAPWPTLVDLTSNPIPFTVFYVDDNIPGTNHNPSDNHRLGTNPFVKFNYIPTTDGFGCPSMLLRPDGGDSGTVAPVPLSVSDALGLISNTDTTVRIYPQTTRWLRKHGLYLYLTLQDSSLADSSTLIKTFLDSTRDANMGAIEKINSDINPTLGTPPNYTDAVSRNYAMISPDTAESTYQSVYGILLKMLLNSQNVPDSAEIALLQPIAN